MAVWPASLPPALVQGYNFSDKRLTVETPMESGPPRRAQLSTHFISNGTMNLALDATQLTALRDVLDVSSGGTEWLTGCPLDAGTGPAAHRIRVTGFQVNVMVPERLWRAIVWFETDERIY